MSKTLQIALAITFIPLVFASASLAQETDYEGITPIEETETIVTPPSTEEIPSLSITERLTNLKSNEEISILNAKTQYLETANSLNSGITTQAQVVDYKLKGLLVTARYRKTLSLYITYLEKLSQTPNNIENTGFEDAGTETEYEDLLQQISEVSNQVTAFGYSLNALDTITDQELNDYSPNIQLEAQSIKTQLEEIKLSMSDIVSQTQ